MLLKSQRSGATSERAHRDQLGLFNEAEAILSGGGKPEEEEPEVSVAGHTRTKRGRRPLPSWMPREEIVHDLPEAEKACPHDGTALVEIARETSEQLELVPAKARVLVHAPSTAAPLARRACASPRCRPSRSPRARPRRRCFAYVAVSKYADALPLYRQEQMLARLGIDLSRATLASWMVRAGELVHPASSWRSLRPWCRRHASTSSATTGCSAHARASAARRAWSGRVRRPRGIRRP